MPAEALLRSVPSIIAAERRYLTPASSPVPQVTSGLAGSSSTSGAVPSVGHSNLLYAATASGFGLARHFSGCATCAPPSGAGISDGLAPDGDADDEASSEGDAEGDEEAEAEGLAEDVAATAAFLPGFIRNGARFLPALLDAEAFGDAAPLGLAAPAPGEALAPGMSVLVPVLAPAAAPAPQAPICEEQA